MIQQMVIDAKNRMMKSIEVLKVDLSKLRTGRAHPSLLDHIKVSYYGNDVPLNQVANVTVENARALAVTPWEKAMVSVIEKAIRESDLGLNPATTGQVIRVPLPALTEERRKDLIRVVRDEIEQARVSIRSVRRDANNHFKELLKDKKISEDEERHAEATMQKLTDQYIADVDKIMATKEADLLEV